MKVYQINLFKGNSLIVSMMYTSKKMAMSDVDFFSKSNGDVTEIWMRVYVRDENAPGYLMVETNECVWEK